MKNCEAMWQPFKLRLFFVTTNQNVDDVRSCDLPLPEILEQHTRWESFTADTDTFQDTITSQLMQDQLSVNCSWFLLLVGNDATDEMGRGGHQCSQQELQLLLVTVGDRLESATLSASTGNCRELKKALFREMINSRSTGNRGRLLIIVEAREYSSD